MLYLASQFSRRIKGSGLTASYHHYKKSLPKYLSPTYRHEPERFEGMSRIVFVPFILFDFFRKQLDVFAKKIDRWYAGRKQISREQLDEYVIRLLDTELLTKDSIIYAFGVSGQIDTEEAIVDRIGCNMWLFDPTPPALAFIEKRNLDERFIFDPIGVWTETKRLKFFTDRHHLNKNFSVVNMYNTDTYIEADCYTLSDIMARKGHHHIDVLKVDIEGSGLPVLEHMLAATDVRPRQITGSLEIPHFIYGASPFEVFGVIRRKKKMFDALEKNGYRILTHSVSEFIAIKNQD